MMNEPEVPKCSSARVACDGGEAKANRNCSWNTMIRRLDHLVLTTAFPEKCVQFYTAVLGMQLETFGANNERKAFKFGQQKINLHIRGQEFEPKAHLPVPGALDLCFVADVPLDRFIAHCQELDVPIIEGPVQRTGAIGKIRSVYVRDPDLNLIEVSEYLDDDGR